MANISPTDEIQSDLTNWQPSGLGTTGTGGTGQWFITGQWIKVSWKLPANAKTPTKFEVCVYLDTGTPQDGPYLINPTQVEPDSRSFQKSVNALGLLPNDISAITKATNAKITTTTSHGFSVGQKVYFTSIGGMTELSTNYGSPTAFATILSVPTLTTFTINVDSTGYSTYTSKGIVTPVQKYKGAVRAIYS